MRWLVGRVRFCHAVLLSSHTYVIPAVFMGFKCVGCGPLSGQLHPGASGCMHLLPLVCMLCMASYLHVCQLLVMPSTDKASLCCWSGHCVALQCGVSTPTLMNNTRQACITHLLLVPDPHCLQLPCTRTAEVARPLLEKLWTDGMQEAGGAHGPGSLMDHTELGHWRRCVCLWGGRNALDC